MFSAAFIHGYHETLEKMAGPPMGSGTPFWGGMVSAPADPRTGMKPPMQSLPVANPAPRAAPVAQQAALQAAAPQAPRAAAPQAAPKQPAHPKNLNAPGMEGEAAAAKAKYGPGIIAKWNQQYLAKHPEGAAWAKKHNLEGAGGATPSSAKGTEKAAPSSAKGTEKAAPSSAKGTEKAVPGQVARQLAVNPAVASYQTSSAGNYPVQTQNARPTSPGVYQTSDARNYPTDLASTGQSMGKEYPAEWPNLDLAGHHPKPIVYPKDSPDRFTPQRFSPTRSGPRALKW